MDPSGSGPSPVCIFPTPSRLSIYFTPASISGTWLASFTQEMTPIRENGYCATSPNSIRARSRSWSGSCVRCVRPRRKSPKKSFSRPITLRKTPTASVTPSFVVSTFSSVPALSKPGVRPSLAAASNSPACSGPSAVPTPSSPSAAAISMAAPKTTGRPVAPPEFHFYVAHPKMAAPEVLSAQLWQNNPMSSAHPAFLYGTAWKEDRTPALTELALRAGFRGIDTANQRRHYFEAGVGEGLAAAYRAGVVTRADLFLQTKFTYQAGQDHRLPYDPSASLAQQVAQSIAGSLALL